MNTATHSSTLNHMHRVGQNISGIILSLQNWNSNPLTISSPFPPFPRTFIVGPSFFSPSLLPSCSYGAQFIKQAQFLRWQWALLLGSAEQHVTEPAGGDSIPGAFWRCSSLHFSWEAARTRPPWPVATSQPLEWKLFNLWKTLFTSACQVNSIYFQHMVFHTHVWSE